MRGPTIRRFFTFHFIIPFIILGLVVVHITILHQTGSRNPLGVKSMRSKLIFHNYFSIKDMLGVVATILLFVLLCIYYPLVLGDDENFAVADPAVTPHHIQPEWYFLFAYAILRSIPNKLGGVIALALSVVVLYVLPFIHLGGCKRRRVYPANKIIFWYFIVVVLLLT